MTLRRVMIAWVMTGIICMSGHIFHGAETLRMAYRPTEKLPYIQQAAPENAGVYRMVF